MFRIFEIIMSLVLVYMAYVVFQDSASPAVLGVLLIIQGMFWSIDFLFIRTPIEEKSGIGIAPGRLAYRILPRIEPGWRLSEGAP